jgi:hypothetical protein
MKTYYGNYLGVVITGGEKDPEGRGRCQVFVPHIMPTLYEGWNREGQDISFDIVGDGLPTSLDPGIVETLKKILPWAECAAPIVGASPSTKNGSEIDRNVNGALSIIGGLSPVWPLSQQSSGGSQGFSSITSAAADEVTASKRCGEAAKNILTDVFGLQNVPGANGHDWGKNLESIKFNNQPAFQKIPVSSPAAAPANSFLVYNSDTRLGKRPRNNGGGLYGHVEYKGTSTSGQSVYIFGRGEVSNPGGSVADNFTGYAYVPVKDLTNKALNNVGQPPINHSSITPDVGVNMRSDGKSGGTIPVQQNGTVAGTDLNAYLKTRLQNSSLIGKGENVLTDAKTYGIKEGTVDEWANFFTKLAQKENAEFNTSKIFTENFKNSKGEFVKSTGLFQVSYESVRGYGVGKGLTDAQLQQALTNPTFNADAAVKIFEQNLTNRNSIIQTRGDVTAGAGYFAMTSMKKIAADAIDNRMGEFAAAAQSGSVIKNPTEQAGSYGPDTNFQALGMFGYASEGTAVWCFFREGNPLFPVYFAASYGQREWQNMYQFAGDQSVGGGDGGAIPNTEKMRLNSYGGGFESAQVMADSEAGTEGGCTFQIYGKNGSNLLFAMDHTELNSVYNHNQRVSGDFHEITEANKETRVRGDFNTYAEQDVYITVGNWSDEAIAASDEIQGYINEAMSVMSQAGKKSSGGVKFAPTKTLGSIQQSAYNAANNIAAAARRFTSKARQTA